MVQLASVPAGDPHDDPDSDSGPVGARERNRLARHREYLRAALHLVFEEGLDALTMQRLATEVGASVGSVYTYFPSKGALLAEVQREAIERLAASALVLSGDVDRVVAGRSADVAHLAPIVAFGRFWLTASATYPEEMQLLMLLLSDVSETVPAEEGGRVVPAALRLLGLAEARLSAATHAHHLDDGDAWSRTIALAASLTGCVQLAVVERWDPDLLSPGAAGRTVLDALLLGWGADPAALGDAHLVVDELATTPLARPLPDGGTA
ncbi:TetR/AcrR family transcriptional regulator [Actinospongicola halichondriae]|uniref:TetR/AcrR family transcriptional regulator n=1 Tax=Actinospongicola halichondriae TaxID=3236844 RepID=UPI003D37C167